MGEGYDGRAYSGDPIVISFGKGNSLGMIMLINSPWGNWRPGSWFLSAEGERVGGCCSRLLIELKSPAPLHPFLEVSGWVLRVLTLQPLGLSGEQPHPEPV